jgi:hypothetical protein
MVSWGSKVRNLPPCRDLVTWVRRDVGPVWTGRKYAWHRAVWGGHVAGGRWGGHCHFDTSPSPQINCRDRILTNTKIGYPREGMRGQGQRAGAVDGRRSFVVVDGDGYGCHQHTPTVHLQSNLISVPTQLHRGLHQFNWQRVTGPPVPNLTITVLMWSEVKWSGGEWSGVEWSDDNKKGHFTPSQARGPGIYKLCDWSRSRRRSTFTLHTRPCKPEGPSTRARNIQIMWLVEKPEMVMFTLH